MLKQILKYNRIYTGLTLYLLVILYPSFVLAGSVTLSWNPPTVNLDGTPVTDLAGFKLYYGGTPGNYTSIIDIGNVTTYQISYLSDGGTYYFAISAYDTSGNESGLSNEVSKVAVPTIQPEPDITIIDPIAPVNDLATAFGVITKNNFSEQTITIRNDGNADLIMSSVAGSDFLNAPFSILMDGCSGQTVAPASICTFKVRFSPSSIGIFSDTFNIPSNDPDENQLIISVNGEGGPVPVPDIAITDPVYPHDDHEVSFGNITTGRVSDQQMMITNRGNADLLIGAIAQSNMLSNPFSIVNDNCSERTITSASSCTFTVRFKPDVRGSYTDSFDIPSNDPDTNTVLITVSGMGFSSDSNNPPSIPGHIFPANYQKALAQNVEFRWEKSADPDGDPVSYDLYVCEDIGLTTGCISTKTAKLTNSNVYYAGLGAQSTGFCLFGIVMFFTGNEKNRQKIIALIAVTAVTGMLLVSCGSSSDSSSSGGVTAGSSNSSIDSNNEISQTVSGLKTGTTYYWKVVATDGRGGSRDSGVWNFDTKAVQ
ncbi:MAG: choice-of-anchor D domain-containing protein [Nitrospirae bacterium]|nr:choice-of-anchor D domain-containing protein [Nitrospirota bacterium]